MSLLLDTHALIWWITDTPIAPEAENDIGDPGISVSVSAVSVWEIAIKEARGKLRIDGRVIDHIERNGFEPLPISMEHAERAGGLPTHHQDPFDRLLIAQAQIEGLTLVTRDRYFDSYDVKVLRC